MGRYIELYSHPRFADVTNGKRKTGDGIPIEEVLLDGVRWLYTGGISSTCKNSSQDWKARGVSSLLRISLASNVAFG